MLKTRLCKQCNCSFQGGPRAYYCPSCRAERQTLQNKAYKSRKLKGDTRPLGSTDKCERCGNDYTVNSSLQRFCSDCRKPHTMEYDRETSLEFYNVHKDNINPVRNERRRHGLITCAWCEKEFETHTRAKYCCPECRKAAKNHQWNEKYSKK